MITSTDYDLLIIRQGAELVSGSHLTPEQCQQVMQDWRDYGNRPVEQDGTWIVAFANRHGDFIEITNMSTFPRSVATSHPGTALRVIDGGKKDTIKVAVEVSVTVSTAQLAAA